MSKKSFQRLTLLFWALVLVDLLAVFADFAWLHIIAKPLLMPALMLLLLFTTDTSNNNRNLIFAGLFFSWLGDIFLLFESRQSLFFIFGLASFLLTHICYICYFLSIKSAEFSLLKKYPVYILLVLGYGIGLVLLLFPFLNDLKIPVIIYATVICCMLLSSVHVFFKMKWPANLFFITGAILFVLSDSLLAINKFYQPVPLAGIWIMLTYCAAQYFILRGFIKKGA
jgi:uncharacterized membrane protein YhhN